jgi:hypothetical protein
MYRKFDVTGNLFLHSALFKGSKHSPSTSAIMRQYVGPDVAFAEDVDSFMVRLATICCLYVSYPYFQVY